MPPAAKPVDTPFRRLLRRLAWIGGGAAVLVFAVQGGEYSTLDLVRSRAKLRVVQASVDSLQRHVDSLDVEYTAVTKDPARLERLAREHYGMVKGDKELLYWVGGAARADSDSVVVVDSARVSRRDSAPVVAPSPAHSSVKPSAKPTAKKPARG